LFYVLLFFTNYCRAPTTTTAQPTQVVTTKARTTSNPDTTTDNSETEATTQVSKVDSWVLKHNLFVACRYEYDILCWKWNCRTTPSL